MTHHRHVTRWLTVAFACSALASVSLADSHSPQAASNAPLLTESHGDVPLAAARGVAVADEGLVGPRRQADRSTADGVQDERAWYQGTIPALAIVLALIVGASMVIKRFSTGGRLTGRAGPIEVLSTTPLSPKQSLSLVRCGQRVILIGVTPDHISALSELTDSTEIALLLGKAQSNELRSMGGHFLDTLDDAGDDYDQDDVAWDAPLESDPTGGEIASTGREVQGLLSRLREYRSRQMSG